MERTLNQGRRGVSGSSSGTDKESLADDDDDDNDNEDDSDGDEDYNLPFDPATLADLEPLSHEESKEMELDPNANENGFNQGILTVYTHFTSLPHGQANRILMKTLLMRMTGVPGQYFRLRKSAQVGLYFELHFHLLTNIETFPSGTNIDAGTPPFSVLDAHHKKNRKVHAPNLRDLEHSGHYRPSNPRRKRRERKVPPMQTRLESNCEAEDEAPNGGSDSSDDDAPKKRAPRNSNDKTILGLMSLKMRKINIDSVFTLGLDFKSGQRQLSRP